MEVYNYKKKGPFIIASKKISYKNKWLANGFKMTTMFFIKIQMQDKLKACLHNFNVYSRS